MKVLVVDNDLMILKIVERIIQKEGHQVVTVQSGAAAIDILEQEPFDVLFIDYIMPNIDGRTLCKLIRDIPHLNESTIVILSAVETDQWSELKAFGADTFIEKGPVAEMAAAICNLLRLHKKPPG